MVIYPGHPGVDRVLEYALRVIREPLSIATPVVSMKHIPLQEKQRGLWEIGGILTENSLP
jgi:hypothetical protein